MDPTVVAACIAAGVSVLTLVGTLAAQHLGRRAAATDVGKAFAEQRELLERTLAEQRDHLDRTLAEQRTTTLNERFGAAAEQLGSDKPAAVRLSGVYAMAGLADDWEANRQTCLNVLCAYLRMPYEPDPGEDSPVPDQLEFQANREVRHTIIQVITAHLRKEKRGLKSWQGLDFNFTGVTFDGGDFSSARFSGGIVNFKGAKFVDDVVDFSEAKFCGSIVDFSGTQFCGGKVDFNLARFSGGGVSFNYAHFSCGEINFCDTRFSGATVNFTAAKFSGSIVWFQGAVFSGGTVNFTVAEVSGGKVDFTIVKFSGGEVGFSHARFPGGTVDFRLSRFSGSSVNFRHSNFSGTTADFSQPHDWSFPPEFPWAETDTPPSGVRLPVAERMAVADVSREPLVRDAGPR